MDIFWANNVIGQYWYMLGDDTDMVHRFNPVWGYTNSYFVSGQDGSPVDICWANNIRGQYWYMLGDDFNMVYRYDPGWGYIGVDRNVGSQDSSCCSIEIAFIVSDYLLIL